MISFWWILCITWSQWQKILVLYPEALKEKPKNSFSAAPSLGFATLDKCKNYGPVNWSPVRSPGTSCYQSNIDEQLEQLDENALWIASCRLHAKVNFNFESLKTTYGGYDLPSCSHSTAQLKPSLQYGKQCSGWARVQSSAKEKSKIFHTVTPAWGKSMENHSLATTWGQSMADTFALAVIVEVLGIGSLWESHLSLYVCFKN